MVRSLQPCPEVPAPDHLGGWPGTVAALGPTAEAGQGILVSRGAAPLGCHISADPALSSQLH